MNISETCRHNREAIAALVLGELDPQAAEPLRRHMEECQTCTDFYISLAEEEKTVRADFDAMAHTLKSGMAFPQPQESKEKSPMRTHAFKKVFTVAAALAGILLLGWLLVSMTSLTGSSIAFADVIQKLDEIRTVTYTMTMEMENKGQIKQQVELLIPGRMRCSVAGGAATSILDLQEGKSLLLVNATRTAVLIDIKNLPAEARQVDYIDGLRKLRDRSSQTLEKKTINGKEAQGFLVDEGGIRISLWADSKTGLPLRMECENAGQGVKVILSDFAYNVDLDPTLFSLDVPEGFALQETGIDLSASPEEGFMAFLRMFAERAEDHTFPPSLDLKELAETSEKLWGKNPPQDIMVKIVFKTVGFQIFMLNLQKAGSPWHYAGKGVKLGTPDTPIFWWRAKDAQKYSVIYADLTMEEDVDPAELPQTP